MILEETVANELLEAARKLDANGELLSHAQLAQAYGAFRQRFAPDVLARLDGSELLTALHGSGRRDGLMYWLEFKNDDEFPSRFGSIAGGSALKFEIYWSSEKQTWITGGPRNLVEIGEQEALRIARRQRDELASGAAALARLSAVNDVFLQGELQAALDGAAPTIGAFAWCHKYFSLLFPDVVAGYHMPHYGRYHLIRSLVVPPEGDGRFRNDGLFAAIARELDLPLNHLAACMDERDGRAPRGYWRIGTREGVAGASRWRRMRELGCAAVGWPNLGDLSATAVLPMAERKERLRAMLADRHPELYGSNESIRSNNAGQIARFIGSIAAEGISTGDVVVAMDGQTALGVGIVTGGYEYHEGEPFPHARPVDWRSDEVWKMDLREGLMSTVRGLGKYAANLVEIERKLLAGAAAPPPPARIAAEDIVPLPPLAGVPLRIAGVLERKGQVILYGPPGTGKTYWAERTACELAARAWFEKGFGDLSAAERAEVTGGAVLMCCFHPAYGYEDFLEGYRPEVIDGAMVFQRRDGIFKKLCQRAAARPDRPFYLIIDEINRGDVPRIFGELLLVMEKDKRGRQVLLPQSGEPFSVPRNVNVIGTMNTADRSIALLDAALRRRFGFVELMPDASLLGDATLHGLPLRRWLQSLNRRIVQHVGRDGRNLQIGHSYFLTDQGRALADFATFARVIADDIVPLVEEYCYEDYSVLERILGSDLVDPKAQRIRSDLFAPDRADDLVRALLLPDPDMVMDVPPTEQTNAPDNGDDGDGGAFDDEGGQA